MNVTGFLLALVAHCLDAFFLSLSLIKLVFEFLQDQRA